MAMKKRPTFKFRLLKFTPKPRLTPEIPDELRHAIADITTVHDTWDAEAFLKLRLSIAFAARSRTRYLEGAR